MAPTTSEHTPQTIDLTKPRYDQSTYSGRLLHFASITNPLNLFHSSASLENARVLVRRHQNGQVDPTVSVKTYLRAKTLCDATFHPDTGEPIFLPFRMSAFVPVNIPILAGLLIPNASVATIIGWQWFNQSMNVAYNWANANKSTPLSTREMATAYAGAVATSCTLAVGLDQLAIRGYLPATLRSLTPFTAVSLAGIANVFLMRRKELEQGIIVTDEDGKPVGKSKKAGFKAVSSVACSRVCGSIPSLTIPPLIMQYLRSHKKISPRMHMPINISLISLALMAGLPSAIAIFPQQACVDTSRLEPELQNLTNAAGERVERVYYNKGL